MHPTLFLPLIASLGPGAAGADDESGSATAIALRSSDNGRSTETYAVVNGAEILVPPDALRALGLTVSAAERRDLVSLREIAGLQVSLDPATGEATVSCPVHCYAMQTFGDEGAAPATPFATTGAFLNVDLNAEAVEGRRALAGAFEFVAFGPPGQGELSWTAGARGDSEVVRLESRWTMDAVRRRVRLRLGDSVTSPGMTGVPYRFAGLQLARDFSLDPRFVTFPTPSLTGVAATPSVVDLYVNGVLQRRERVDAGPFSVTQTPTMSGSGAVRVVVTDSLGRQQETWAPFYSSRALLKPGLTDFSFALGAAREQYAVKSAAYGDLFASGVYRRGMSNALTLEARGEGARDRVTIGGGLSTLVGELAQGDVATAISTGQGGAGARTRVAVSRIGPHISATADMEYATRKFAQVGAPAGAPRLRAAFALSAYHARVGSATLSATTSDARIGDDVSTISLAAYPQRFGAGAFGVFMSYAASDRRAFTAGVRLAFRLGRGSASTSAEATDGRWSLHASAQEPAPSAGGLGWRAASRTGDIERQDAGVRLETMRGVVGLDASRVGREQGVRGQAAFGLAWIDGGLHAARPLQESFALVDAHAGNVRVTLDNRPVARTGASGKALVTGLRAYHDNRIGILVEDLPGDVPVASDELILVPAARAGAVARFPVALGRAGEVRVVDEHDTPLPAGSVLVRADNGARHPVGEEGRVYVEGVRGPVVLQRLGEATCAAVISTDLLDGGRQVVCAQAGG